MYKFIVPTFLIILSGGLFFLHVDPTYKNIKILKESKAQYSEALDKSRELREIRDSLLSKYNSIDPENIKRLEKILPDNVDNVKLIMEIDSLASGYGATLRRIDISPVVEEVGVLGKDIKGYNSIDLAMTVESTYDDFVNFLRDLSGSLRIMDVNSLSFESTALDIYQFKLNFRTYWLKQL